MKIFYALLTATWVGILGWAVWPIGAPIEYLEGDSLVPQRVQVGGTITITRHFRVLREEPATISRTLVRGNCVVTCEVVDLPSSTITLPVQETRTQTRDMVLPDAVEAGTWRAVFAVHWKDRIGRLHIKPLHELTFDVIP